MTFHRPLSPGHQSTIIRAVSAGVPADAAGKIAEAALAEEETPA